MITELATHALGIEPAVFILDNVHFMDEMSWKLLIQVTVMGENSIVILYLRGAHQKSVAEPSVRQYPFRIARCRRTWVDPRTAL